MTPIQLDDLLHVWGQVFGERRVSEWQEDRSPTGNSSLARWGRLSSRQRVKYDVMERDGRSRRQALGVAAGMAEVGKWVCDPVPCKETRVYSLSASIPDPRITPMVDRVQAAWLALHGYSALQAECVRVQYQVRGMTRTQKAELVGANVGSLIAPRRYKDALHDGRLWVHARISA